MKCPAVPIVTAATGSVTKNTEFKALRIDISGPMLCDAESFGGSEVSKGKAALIFKGHAVQKEQLLVTVILIYIQRDATLHSLFYLETALHVSSGTSTHHQERKQLSTTSGICHTVTATCRYRGRVETGVECAVNGVP